MNVDREPAVRLNPDYSVAQVDLDRRTVVLLYAPRPEGEPGAEPPLAWPPEAEAVP